MNNFIEDNEIIYFAEDDYIYVKDADKILKEGMTLLDTDYVTLYDHPDKYINSENGGNPQIRENGEQSIVHLTPSRHWKYTNSTTMTFATKLKTLKEDFLIMRKFCLGEYPEDYLIFCELIQNRNRKLVSCIPGASTHCEVNYLTPLIDWYNVLNDFAAGWF